MITRATFHQVTVTDFSNYNEVATVGALQESHNNVTQLRLFGPLSLFASGRFKIKSSIRKFRCY